ncbi:DUF397 domain-containing protein [Actinomadura sp. J1-007]|nr:DUF397 domain-containing protein [Actinomadura sp. J1-007]
MIEWRKSSYTSGGGTAECVELGVVGGGVAVRDSKDPEGPRVAVTRGEFAVFVGRIKAGGLDL